MKKIILILVLGIGCFNFASAQNQPENLSGDFDQLMKQMEKAMKDMESLFGTSKILMDTLIIKKIDPLTESFDGFPLVSPDSLNMDNMFEILQQQMQQMNAQDWYQLEELMKNFMQQFPELKSAPSISKKRKITTL